MKRKLVKIRPAGAKDAAQWIEHIHQVLGLIPSSA